MSEEEKNQPKCREGVITRLPQHKDGLIFALESIGGKLIGSHFVLEKENYRVPVENDDGSLVWGQTAEPEDLHLMQSIIFVKKLDGSIPWFIRREHMKMRIKKRRSDLVSI